MEPAADATRLVGLVAQTVCDQAHLSPMPLTKQPLVWNFDHALRLYPLPDVLVLGDVVEQVDDNYQGCHFVTPGSFADDGAFVCYLPAQKKTEFSCVN
jgi:DNA polymerase epsilon subunit 2